MSSRNAESGAPSVDCGAGVGRISKNLLLKHFHEVDLLEPARHFLDAARVSLSAEPSGAKGSSGHRAVNFFYQGAQVGPVVDPQCVATVCTQPIRVAPGPLLGRIPPQIWLPMSSYCPVNFDKFCAEVVSEVIASPRFVHQCTVQSLRR